MQGIWFDLKRIFDDKKLFVIVLVSPVLIMILFASFIIPMLFTSKQIGFNIALFNEDKSPEIEMYLSHILKAKSLSDVVHVYPVNQYEKGIELVKEDKVSAFVHIPQAVYQDLEKGEDVSYEIVGLKHHFFEVQLLKMTFDSSFGHVGRGQNVLNLAHDIVLEYDMSKHKVKDFEESLTQSAVNGYMNRRKTLGEDGIISPLFEQFAFEYYLSAIFAMFSFLSIVLCINFTSADFNKFIFKRQVLQGIPTSYLYMRRLLSSAIFILIASLSIYPTFLVLQLIDPNLGGYHQHN
ncbi:MAG TPA: ABC transporter permease, partial [Erysipelothrix sp.]|nr:ABC transporter permease [Erysipelothrix sp.]